MSMGPTLSIELLIPVSIPPLASIQSSGTELKV